MKKLSELYEGTPDIEIYDIKINSKDVVKGDIFVCVKGVTRDRHDFIDEAISNGASAIVVSRDITNKSVPIIKVHDTNLELPILARKFYDYKDDEIGIIGVTGTNGKTTVASIIQTLIGDDLCGYMGTNGISCSRFSESIVNTTPDADRLYKYFKKFVDSGCKYLSMEASSESFYRKRLNNLEFEVGIITNITEDHLNIHKTIENYIDCKCQLLRQVKKNGFCILNRDDKYYEKCLKEVNGNFLTYGKNDADLLISDISIYSDKTTFTISYKGKNYVIDSPLLGEFNVYNLCAALLGTIALGYSLDEVIPKIKNIKVPSGRVEFLNYGQEFKIVLDYAHTPDAFSKIYPLLHEIKQGKIITVTGSAGGREKEKRAPMGKIVLDNSDYVIFTMDDPRYEDVNEIIDDLVSGSLKTNYERIIDRKEAIFKAFDIAEKDDVVLVAGKGTDNYMAIEDKYLPYCDLDVIEEYFKESL